MGKDLTKTQAVKAYNAIVARHLTDAGAIPQAGTFRQGGDLWPSAPVLVEDYGSFYSTTRWAIVWEEGPYEWALTVGQENVPDGVFAEPIESFSLGLYPA